MIVFEGCMQKMSPLEEPVALTIGNFDGVHLGHVGLISQLQALAKKRGVKTGVLTFHPHPSEIIDKQKSLGFLQTQEAKRRSLEKLGVDYLVVQDFSRSFADVSREDFLRQYVMPFFQPKIFLLGYDFKFGQAGRGNFDFAKNFLPDVEVYQGQRFCDELGETVSSSNIRKALLRGDIQSANRGLGALYKIQGVVQSGQALGRDLGFPTANMGKIETLIPGKGVYAGFAYVDSRKEKAVLNIGTRPTIKRAKGLSCECHMLNFSGNIYDQKIQFEFVQRVRSEKRFLNLDDLKQQICKDVSVAQKILENHES